MRNHGEPHWEYQKALKQDLDWFVVIWGIFKEAIVCSELDVRKRGDFYD